jgi:hypothetical protein
MRNITDYFVTALANNDFLSTHNDAAAGSAVFVYFLRAVLLVTSQCARHY